MPHHAPFSIQDIQSAVEQGREAERARIIELRRQEFGEDYYNMGVVGRIVALIEGESK
jgi:predicted PhzF superfamily epimerase YddE/YHI9